jgi:MFS family permease
MATFTMFIDFSVAITAPIFGFLVTSIGYRSSFLISASTSGVALVLLHVVLSPRWAAAIHQRTV